MRRSRDKRAGNPETVAPTKEAQASQYARSLIEASLDPLVTISPEGKITDVNEAAIKVTGVPRQRLIGTDFSDYFTERDKARAGYREVFEKGFVTDYPLTIRHKDGRLTDVLYNASVYTDMAGKVMGVFAAARDVTAQKQASQYARSLVEASLDPLVTISPDGKITDVNEATVKVTGVRRDELIGSDFSNYFTEPERAIGRFSRKDSSLTMPSRSARRMGASPMSFTMPLSTRTRAVMCSAYSRLRETSPNRSRPSSTPAA